jgi:hypothetical protein
MRKLFLTLLIAVFFLSTQLIAQEDDMHYEMKCYNQGQKCPCNKKTKKKVANLSGKKNKRLASKSDAKKRARAKALALRNAAKENQKLKDELEALRRANLIAAAKQQKTPSEAQLAEGTEVSAPKMVVSKEEISSAVAETGPVSAFYGSIENAVNKDVEKEGANSPLSDTTKVVLGFRPLQNDDLKIHIEPAFAWVSNNNVDTTTNSSSYFEMKNTPIVVEHNNIAKFEKISSVLKGSLTGVIPTNGSDRNGGLIMGIQSNLTFHTDFDNTKGNVELSPGFAFDIRQNTTAAPSANASSVSDDKTFTTSDGSMFEKLDPNTQYTVSTQLQVQHSIVDHLAAAIWLKFNFNKKYADTMAYNGSLLTVTPDLWENKMELGLKAPIDFTNKGIGFGGEIGFVSKGLVSGFRPFSSSDNNLMSLYFKISYSF